MTDPLSVLDAIPLPALLVRADERVEAANVAARNLFGQTIVGRHFIAALRQPDLLDAIEASLRDGAPREAELLTTEDQRDVTFAVTIRAVPLATQRGLLICLRDESDLRRATEMRTDFVANVSHELRTPLTALLGFIETLQGPALNDDAAKGRFLGIMQREAERMNRLVGDLLSLSRVEALSRVRPVDPVELTGLIRSSLNGLAPLASGAGVTLQSDLPDQEVRVPGDADQLRQVLTNLCENAIKYGGEGAAVTVSLGMPRYEARLRADGVQVKVQDTGPGIDPLDIPRLTERFYRVDNHRSREKGGTGLGLAIVKHIVTRHKGRLRIDSAPAEGSSFVVLLPVRAS